MKVLDKFFIIISPSRFTNVNSHENLSVKKYKEDRCQSPEMINKSVLKTPNHCHNNSVNNRA